jgi:3',5'-cyclic AMP phosphodiesterase CpdA
MASYGILHLSDLHFKTGDSPEALLGPLREDLKSFVNIPIEFVVISGDLTDRGAPAGLALAADFIRLLSNITKVPFDRFVVCPGNHDVEEVKSAFALREKIGAGEELGERAHQN